MMLFGFSGAISVNDDPTQAMQGTCPAGFVESAGYCVAVTSTAPAELLETDPSKLPPASRIDWKKLAVLTLLGAAIGVGAHFFKR